MTNNEDNVISLPTNVEHWEGLVRCMLCGAEHRAVAPVISWAEGRQPVDCGSCGAVRSCIEVDVAREEVMAMTPEQLHESLRADGFDPERVANDGCALVRRLCDEHRERSRVERLEQAARDAVAAMSAVADGCEAEDLQTAHYLRHRIDALRLYLPEAPR